MNETRDKDEMCANDAKAIKDLQAIVGLEPISLDVAEDGHVTYLDITNRGLKTVPNAIRSLKYLEYLDLSNNLITALPDWIGDLSRLRDLNVNDNRLERLPEGMKRLGSLSSLEMRDNRLHDLPAWLATLPLEDLDMTNTFDYVKEPRDYSPEKCNRLASFPSWILETKRLRYVNMTGVFVPSIPANVTFAEYPWFHLPTDTSAKSDKYKFDFTTDLGKPEDEIVADRLDWIKRNGIIKPTKRDLEAAWRTMLKSHQFALFKFNDFFNSISAKVYDKTRILSTAAQEPFACKYCSESYKNQGGLTKHVRLRHQKEYEDEYKARVTKELAMLHRYDEESLQLQVAARVAREKYELRFLRGEYDDSLECLKEEIGSLLASERHEIEMAKAGPKENEFLIKLHTDSIGIII
nr:leucine-rich repeat domain-containing protein [Candidatus Sigynarchaeum springense]